MTIRRLKELRIEAPDAQPDQCHLHPVDRARGIGFEPGFENVKVGLGSEALNARLTRLLGAGDGP